MDVPENIREEFHRMVDTTVPKVAEAINGVPIIVAVSSCLHVITGAIHQIPTPDILEAMGRSLQHISQDCITLAERIRFEARKTKPH